ncbi:MAG: ABC transporter substrate-binding protein [Candidatus Brachytrichaceae bacterium NZ_4S206]|jgi:NitT/TauT family transport system substrate-binding protein
MMKHFVTFAFASVALLAACAAPPAARPAAPAQPATELKTVKFGFVPVAINGPVYVAAEKGYFAEEGLKVEFLPIEGGSDAVVQVASGNFDVAGGGISASMLNAVARGIEFEIAASLHTERPPLASPFVVSKKRYESGELTKMSDLKGKKVATNNRGTATEWWLSEALRQGGVDITEVEVLGLPFPQVAPALESGTLDGAILTEPFATAAEDKGLIVRLSEDFVDGFKPTYIYFNKGWVTANPDLATRFIKAYLRGARDLQGEAYFNDANVAAISKYTKVEPNVIKRARRPHFDPNGTVSLEDIQTLQQFYRKQGLLNYEQDLDMSRFVNTKYVEEALKALGGTVEFK